MKCKHCKKLFKENFHNEKYCSLCKKIKKHEGNIKQYKISIEEYNYLLKKQNGVCAICLNIDKTRKLAVDHDHETMKVRGLLCFSCNIGLGYFKDSRILLIQAIKYLNKL
jgi:hypothetical protein